MDLIIESATKTTLAPLGRQILALILSTVSSSSTFAQVYWTKYQQPRRQAFRVVIERAKARNEIQSDTDSDLIFDLLSGAMLYRQVFPPTNESFEAYMRRVLTLFLKSTDV